MTQEENKNGPLRPRLFTPDGKPLRVLSTSLGIALLANALYATGAASAQTGTGEASSSPVLVEWSSEEVKAYFDPSVDWNIPLPGDEEPQEETDEGEGTSTGGGASGGGGSSGGGGTTVIHSSSGFGWDDLMLYHLIFNRGSSYSSSAYHAGHAAYDARTGAPYATGRYSSDTFQNKPVVGSAVRPKTSASSGTITRRSTSSSPGEIGGRSSGFTSSGSSHSSGGFGG